MAGNKRLSLQTHLRQNGVTAVQQCPNRTPAQQLQFEEGEQREVPGASSSSGYKLMHEPDFPVLKIGSRMVAPNEKFL